MAGLTLLFRARENAARGDFKYQIQIRKAILYDSLKSIITGAERNQLVL